VEKSGFLDRIAGSSIICPDGNRAWKFAAEKRGIPVQAVVHQVKNFTAPAPKMFRGVPNIAGTQTLDRSWRTLKEFLPAHMVLKHKDRGHSTMHPSVTVHVVLALHLGHSRSPTVPGRTRTVAVRKKDISRCQLEVRSDFWFQHHLLV
jgi:hypothetical protein